MMRRHSNNIRASRRWSTFSGGTLCIIFLSLLVIIPSALSAPPPPGIFGPQDFLGGFQLDERSSSEDCPTTLEYTDVNPDAKTGGFLLERSSMKVDGEECKGSSGYGIRVLPGSDNLNANNVGNIRQFANNVKAMMSGVDEGDGDEDYCNGIGKGTWMFVREAEGAGSKTLRVLQGREVNLEAGVRNVVYMKDGDKEVCRFVGVSRLSFGRKKKRRRRPSIGGDDEEEEEEEEEEDQNEDEDGQQDGEVNDLSEDNDDDDDNDLTECFPADASVTLDSGARKSMDKLQIGDRVLVSTTAAREARFSPVILFTHRDGDVRATFVKITTTHADEPLYLTQGHFLYANNRLTAAENIKLGDIVSHINGDDTVASVERVVKQGLYNPQTENGDIVVNNILASTFTRAVHPTLAKGLMMPVRLAYRCGLSAFDGVFDQGPTGIYAPVVRFLQRVLPAYKR